MYKQKIKTKLCKILKGNRGITLIALVITIIVLLILAGVTITTLIGENGILDKAKTSEEQTKKAIAYEKVEIAILGSYNKNTVLDKDLLINNLKKAGGIIEEEEWPIIVIMDGYVFEIDEDGKIECLETEISTEEEIKPDISKKADENISFATGYGTIDIIWLRTGNTVTDKPNRPVLKSGEETMNPVIFDNDTWKETTENDPNWYDYKEGITIRDDNTHLIDNTLSHWANARTKNESYFVWIPRYAYRITYYANENSTTPTGYCDGYGMWNAKDGSIKYELDKGIETVDYKGKKYIIHPAFGTHLENGGWTDKLSGFWFAKFETSGKTPDELKSIYGVKSQNAQSISMQYTNARQAKYGYKGTIDDDGYTSFMHSHMVKNSEWGAVAYLTHSKYGRNGNEIEVNTKSPFVTGGDEGLAYIDNVLQSTTGNVYGIYDMSGGGWERTATFDKKGDETQLDYGKDMVNTTKVNDNYVSTKYVTIYENGTSTYVGHDIFKIGKIGDATKEISSRNDGNEGYYCRWFGDQSFFFNQNSPYVARGGYNAGSTGSGIFCCNNCTGVSRRL